MLAVRLTNIVLYNHKKQLCKCRLQTWSEKRGPLTYASAIKKITKKCTAVVHVIENILFTQNLLDNIGGAEIGHGKLIGRCLLIKDFL